MGLFLAHPAFVKASCQAFPPRLRPRIRRHVFFPTALGFAPPCEKEQGSFAPARGRSSWNGLLAIGAMRGARPASLFVLLPLLSTLPVLYTHAAKKRITTLLPMIKALPFRAAEAHTIVRFLSLLIQATCQVRAIIQPPRDLLILRGQDALLLHRQLRHVAQQSERRDCLMLPVQPLFRRLRRLGVYLVGPVQAFHALQAYPCNFATSVKRNRLGDSEH